MRFVKVGNYIPKEVDTKDFLTETRERLYNYYKDSKEWFRDNYEDILIPGKINYSDKRQFIIVYDVEDKCKLVGFALLKMTKDDKKVATLYVAKDYKNKGIGSMLLKEAVTYFKEEPYIFFSEKVLLDNPLFPYVLIKNGFKFTEKKDEQYYFKYSEV